MVAVKTNYALNPSFEVAFTGIESTGVTLSQSAFAPTVFAGTKSANLVAAGTGATTYMAQNSQIPVATGGTFAAFTFSARWSEGPRWLRPCLGHSLDGGATWQYPSTSWGDYISMLSNPAGTPPARYALAVPIPAGTTHVRAMLYLYTDSNGTAPNVSGAMATDAWKIALGDTKESAITEGLAYFDGSTPADSTYTYSWTGTPHASVSIAEYVPYYPQAEAVLEAGKPPRVDLTIHSIPGEQVIRVERTAGGETTIVPGARRKRGSVAILIPDFFPALGLPTTYTVYVGTQAVGQTTITVESESGWLQDPIYPDQAVPVVGHGGVSGALKLTSDSLQEVSYPVTGTEHQTMGGRYGVVIGSGRGGAEGINLTHSSYDRELDAAVRELVQDAPILVFRPPPGLQPLPPVTYLHATFTGMPMTTHWGGSLARFLLAGNLVQAIFTAYRSGLATYADVQGILSGYTYGDVAALQAGKSYLDVQKNPTKI